MTRTKYRIPRKDKKQLRKLCTDTEYRISLLLIRDNLRSVKQDIRLFQKVNKAQMDYEKHMRWIRELNKKN